MDCAVAKYIFRLAAGFRATCALDDGRFDCVFGASLFVAQPANLFERHLATAFDWNLEIIAATADDRPS